MIGDLILEVNGQDIRKSPYNDVAFLLKTLPQGKVILKIGRFKTSANVSASNSANVSTNTSANDSKQTSRRNSITLLNNNNNNNTQLTETTTQQDTQQQSSSNLSSFKSKK
jgi:C-terminal processing protease CtpA/Prc